MLHNRIIPEFDNIQCRKILLYPEYIFKRDTKQFTEYYPVYPPMRYNCDILSIMLPDNFIENLHGPVLHIKGAFTFHRAELQWVFCPRTECIRILFLYLIKRHSFPHTEASFFKIFHYYRFKAKRLRNDFSAFNRPAQSRTIDSTKGAVSLYFPASPLPRFRTFLKPPDP